MNICLHPPSPAACRRNPRGRIAAPPSAAAALPVSEPPTTPSGAADPHLPGDLRTARRWVRVSALASAPRIGWTVGINEGGTVSTKPTVVISFKDISVNDSVREALEAGCQRLAGEFPETTRFELTLAPDGGGHTAHAHVTGRSTEVAAHAEAVEIGEAADRLLDKLERQLRRVHDKRLFSPRRNAQRENPKRKPS